MARGGKRDGGPADLGMPGGEGTDLGEVADGVEIRRGDDGGPYLAPRSVRGLRGEAAVRVGELQRLAFDRQRVEDAIGELVDQLRTLGVSWSAIGWSVGTTGEAARQRWGAP